MAVEVQSQHKTVVFKYDKSKVKGRTISVQAAQGENLPVEKKNPPNRGTSHVSFGKNFTGSTFIKVEGSTSGEDSGTIHVE